MLLGLNQRALAEGGMQPFPVLEDLDVLEACRSHVVMSSVADTVPPLVLEAVEPTLRRSVVPADPLVAHGAGHRQGVGDDARHNARLERPANDFPVEQIHDDRQVEPAFVRPQIRDVRRPDLVRGGWRKISVQHIVRHRQAVLRIGRHLVSPLVTCPDAMLAHQPLPPVLVGRKAPCPQFPHPARAAIGALEFGMDGADQRHHLGVRQSQPIRRPALLQGSVVAHADLKGRAQVRQGELLPMPVNPGVPHNAFFAKICCTERSK